MSIAPPDYSGDRGAFGTNFSDTRRFRLTPGGAEPIPWQDQQPTERNSGDAATLADAIRWAKQMAPARNMALVFYSHGNGVSWCPDETDQDALYAAELTDVLGADEAVDLMVFDVCNMAGVENAYQWRPGGAGFSANVVVATPMAGEPFPWRTVFERLRAGTAAAGADAYVDPRRMTAIEFGQLIVEETSQERQRMLADPRLPDDYRSMVEREAMCCIDLTQVAAVKSATDALARGCVAWEDAELVLNGLVADPDFAQIARYGDPGMGQSIELGYIDLYGLASSLADGSDAPEKVRALADTLATAVDSMVLSSFGMPYYDTVGGFESGKHGLSIVFPADGPGLASQSSARWEDYNWLHPELLSPTSGAERYGNYAWCRDGAKRGDGNVDTWYELLDDWFDRPEGGGVNGVRP